MTVVTQQMRINFFVIQYHVALVNSDVMITNVFLSHGTVTAIGTVQVVRTNHRRHVRLVITRVRKTFLNVTQESVLIEHLFAMETMTVMMVVMRISGIVAWIVHVRQTSLDVSLV